LEFLRSTFPKGQLTKIAKPKKKSTPKIMALSGVTRTVVIVISVPQPISSKALRNMFMAEIKTKTCYEDKNPADALLPHITCRFIIKGHIVMQKIN
jgi:hypothetical protein